jgi:hypothetical protein
VSTGAGEGGLPYDIGEPLGRGGFGVVHRATRRADGVEVAIKILRDEQRAAPEAVARLEREAAVLATLAHPAIVRIHELGRLSDQRPYLVMDLLSGRDLGARVAAEGRLTPAELLEVLEPVCAALEAAHAKGVLHRDLKPANVFLEDRPSRPRAILLDFGLAKLAGGDQSLTASHEVVGTQATMAPEQIRREALDARTDVYGLGSIVFFALTARMPFEPQPSLGLRELHLYARVPDASALAPVPPAVDAVIARAMSKRAADRFGGPAALLEALRGAFGLFEAGERSCEVAAVHVGWRLAVPPEEVDAGLIVDMTGVLDLARAVLAEAGARVVDELGNGVVAVIERSEAATDVGGEEAVRALAARVRGALDARAGRDDRLRVSVSTTTGSARLAGGRLVGGDVAAYERWTAG